MRTYLLYFATIVFLAAGCGSDSGSDPIDLGWDFYLRNETAGYLNGVEIDGVLYSDLDRGESHTVHYSSAPAGISYSAEGPCVMPYEIITWSGTYVPGLATFYGTKNLTLDPTYFSLSVENSSSEPLEYFGYDMGLLNELFVPVNIAVGAVSWFGFYGRHADNNLYFSSASKTWILTAPLTLSQNAAGSFYKYALLVD